MQYLGDHLLDYLSHCRELGYHTLTVNCGTGTGWCIKMLGFGTNIFLHFKGSRTPDICALWTNPESEEHTLRVLRTHCPWNELHFITQKGMYAPDEGLLHCLQWFTSGESSKHIVFRESAARHKRWDITDDKSCWQSMQRVHRNRLVCNYLLWLRCELLPRELISIIAVMFAKKWTWW